jgi:DNA-binding winged helix-turn-helix (wHTH) protein/TolB-like protein
VSERRGEDRQEPLEGAAYVFGVFRLEPAEQRLLRDGSPVPLTPKVLKTLVVLVENAGRLVPKETLMERIWPDTFVAEVTLAHNVSVLRKTLGDASGGRPWIETVAKNGYRFLGEVRVAPPEPVRAEQAPPEKAPPVSAGRRFRWLELAALAAAAAAAIWLAAARRQERPAPRGLVRSVAVLPFRSLGGRPDEAYLELGVAEGVISRLSRIPGLEVRPLRAVERYRATAADTHETGRALGVEAVLDGTLQRERATVRLTAYLRRVSDGALLWSGTITDVSANLLTAEEGLAAQLTAALRPAIGARAPSESRPPDPIAYELYLRGRHLWNRRTPDSVGKSVPYFDQAVARDPGFAAAFATLADAHALLAGLGWGDARKELAAAKSAAAESLRLDEGLGQSHSVLALIAENYEYDFPRAEREYRRAIELSPGDPISYHRLGELFGLLGRFDEGLALLTHASAMDPLSPIIHADTAKVLGLARRDAEQEKESARVLELEPDFAPAVLQHASALRQLGRREAALAETERFLRLDPSLTARTAAGPAFIELGQRGRTEAILTEALAASARGEAVVPLYVAQLFGSLGRRDEAIEWLERSYREGNILLGIGANPSWVSMHGDPRFQALCRKLGLPIVEVPADSHQTAKVSPGR